MKLISCYIENYGKISKRRIDFDENITSVCEANGYGKTTLASFLKAMFYGLDGYRINAKDFGDRKRYYPFSGGSFGGNLTFIFNGDEYKIERFFDEKSDIKDELTVFKNGEQFFGLGDRIGETVFGIDKESFERTVFIDGSDVKISSTASIGRKLEGFLSGNDADFDKAIDALKETAGKYKKSKKANDLITAEKERNERLRAEIANKQEIKSSLEEKYSRLNDIKTELSGVEEKLKTSLKTNEIFAQWENYDALKNTSEKIREEITKREGKYPSGVLSQDEIKSASEIIQKLKILTARESVKRQSGKREELIGKFANGLPSAEELAETESRINKYTETEKEYLSEPEYITETVRREKSNKNGYLTALLLALGVIGVIVAFFSLTVGLIMTAIGFLGSAFSYLNAKTEALKSVTEVKNINPRKTQLKDALSEERRLIGRFFIKYGYREESSFLSSYAVLKKDIEDYSYYQKERETEDVENKNRAKEINSLKEELFGLFNKYGIKPTDYAEELEEIKAYLSRIKYLNERLLSSEEEAKKFAEEKSLTERPQGEKEDVGELVEKQAYYSALKVKTEKEIEEAEWQAEKLDELETEKALSDERLKEYANKYALLKATSELLTEAEKNIIEKYVSPIRNGYEKYASALEKTLGERISMNKNFEITFEEGGKERSEMHRSQGERSIIALCFRLALIENMFKAEAPFVILDDPFAHLDNEHIAKVKTLLKELSTSLQIIYFTCHESRKL